MADQLPLPQPDAYEYLIANVWRTETHFNGVKANDHRCLYSTDKVHSHAAAVSAADNAALRAELIEVQADRERWIRRADKTWHEKQFTDEIEALRADNIRLQNEVVRPLRERVKVLEDALLLAYGHLWLVNDEPGTPIRLHSSGTAASIARAILRSLLDADQRERGINAARAALGDKT